MNGFVDVFDSDGGDYTFSMSHIAISGRGVDVVYEPAPGGGLWVLTQEDPGRRLITVRHPDKTAAVLLLIAARLGLTGELRYRDEE